MTDGVKSTISRNDLVECPDPRKFSSAADGGSPDQNFGIGRGHRRNC